ncbi:MAG: pentapeptide repeat-containing protein [Deltaproteobacteria bacterium]|nr:pentapeptide repeat-containing protein [Deltaproteobacteria bacterium]
MKWSELKGAVGKLVGGGRGPGATAAPTASAASSLNALREGLRSSDVGARVSAIAGLAELAANDPSQHWAVVDLLVGFLRDRCPYLGNEVSDGPAADVQAVVQALGQRRHVETEKLPLGLFQVDLRNTDFSEARLEHADFSRSHLEASDFTGAALAGANFQEAYLDDAHFMNADLVGANFLAADLRRTNFTGAVLRTVHFEEASMEGVVLVGARLDGAVLTGANLAGARLEGADLAGAVGLARDQLAGAVTDGRTVLPHLD